MTNEFQTLRIIPDDIESASRFGPGFSVGADRGVIVRDEFILLRKIAAMTVGFASDDALGTRDAQRLVDVVTATQGTAPETLIANLQDAGDALLSAIMNGDGHSVILAAYQKTMINLLALMR